MALVSLSSWFCWSWVAGSVGQQEQDKQTEGGHSIRGMMRRMQRIMAKAGLLAYVLLDGVVFG
jgi:hypothetical protein